MIIFANQLAGMVKLVDTPDLGSGAARCEGSSPFTRTYNKSYLFDCQIFKTFLFFSNFSFIKKALNNVQGS